MAFEVNQFLISAIFLGEIFPEGTDTNTECGTSCEAFISAPKPSGAPSEAVLQQNNSNILPGVPNLSTVPSEARLPDSDTDISTRGPTPSGAQTEGMLQHNTTQTNPSWQSNGCFTDVFPSDTDISTRGPNPSGAQTEGMMQHNTIQTNPLLQSNSGHTNVFPPDNVPLTLDQLYLQNMSLLQNTPVMAPATQMYMMYPPFIENISSQSLPLHSFPNQSLIGNLTNMSFNSSLFDNVPSVSLESSASFSAGQSHLLNTSINRLPHQSFHPQLLPLTSTPVRQNKLSDLNTSNMPSPVQPTPRPQKRKSTDPLDDTESSEFSELFIRAVNNSSDKSLLQVTLGTHKSKWLRLPETYVDASNASDRTLRRRANFCEKVREHTQAKLSQELIRMSESERSETCKEAGVQSVHLSKEEGVALKVFAELPWYKLEKVQQFYKHKGATHEGQAAQRKFKKSLLGNQLHTNTREFKVKDETSPYAVNGFVIVKAPCCTVSSLIYAIFERLDRLKALNQLTWHHGKINPNEIWVKISGDKGGGTMKCGFQIVNVQKPNNPNNYILFCTFSATDNYYNLNAALSPFAPEVEVLKEVTWEGKRVKPLGTGDCDYTYKNFGMGGAGGLHCCFGCEIPRDEMQLKPDDRKVKSYPKRTISSLKENYKKFKEDGGDIKKQKLYKNVIHPHILGIEPEDYCPPQLHLDLGIPLNLYKHCIIEVHGLDIDIADDLAQFDIRVGDTNFDKYISVKQFILVTEERILEIEDELDDLLDNDKDDTVTLDEVRKYIEKLSAEKDELEKRKESLESKLKIPKKECGPLVDALDKGLQRNGIHMQAYHGKSFVGNDVHKFLKEDVYSDVFDGMVKVCKTLTGNQEIIDNAMEIAKKYKIGVGLYSTVHMFVAHSDFMEPEEIPLVHDAIKDFMAYYRSDLKLSVTVKCHILEDHIIPWLERYPFGLGLLGEQGTESVHAVINRIKRNYQALPSEEKRLQTIVEEHSLRCAPELSVYFPPKKTYRPRKKPNVTI